MISRSLALFLLGVAAGTAAYAQQSITPPQQPDAPQAFAWSFDGNGGYLGVETQEVTKDNFSKFGLNAVRGVAVSRVAEKSPAEAAGLRTGDVIVRFNGDEVTSVRKLTRLVGEVDPDHQATVTVLRGGREQDINVTVGKRPMPEFSNGNFQFNMPQLNKMDMPDLKNMPQPKDFPNLKEMPQGEFREFQIPNGKGFVWSGSGRQIGVGIVPLSKQLAGYFRVDGGALIDEVRADSPAAKAGLKAGDIIVEANGKPVKNDLDLIRLVNEKKDGDVQLTVVRDGSRQTVNVTPEAGKDGNFFFKSGNEDGMMFPRLPMAPRGPQIVRPALPATPAMMQLFRSGRII